MALTKVSRGLLSTGIVDNSNATAITIDSSENVGIGTSSPSRALATKSSSATVANFESTSATAGFISFSDSNTTNDVTVRAGAVGDNLVLQAGGAERMRVDSSGTLFLGKTSTGLGTNGVELRPGGLSVMTNTNGSPLAINREGNDGQLIGFYNDAVAAGAISVQNTYFFIAGGSAGGTHSGFRFINNLSIRPCTATGANSNNVVAFGSSTSRWTVIFATTGTINTSDVNEKQDIEELSDAEQRVAVAAKGLLRKFRWIDAVEAKGDDARIHFGIIAQDLEAAFEAEGLDAGRYAMFCSDTFWVDSEGESYDTAEEAPEGATEQTRLGVRYSELLAFIISAI